MSKTRGKSIDTYNNNTSKQTNAIIKVPAEFLSNLRENDGVAQFKGLTLRFHSDEIILIMTAIIVLTANINFLIVTAISYCC